jgi:hypothetical protein
MTDKPRRGSTAIFDVMGMDGAAAVEFEIKITGIGSVLKETLNATVLAHLSLIFRMAGNYESIHHCVSQTDCPLVVHDANLGEWPMFAAPGMELIDMQPGSVGPEGVAYRSIERFDDWKKGDVAELTWAHGSGVSGIPIVPAGFGTTIRRIGVRDGSCRYRFQCSAYHCIDCRRPVSNVVIGS